MKNRLLTKKQIIKREIQDHYRRERFYRDAKTAIAIFGLILNLISKHQHTILFIVAVCFLFFLITNGYIVEGLTLLSNLRSKY